MSGKWRIGATIVVGLCITNALGNVNLELRPVQETVRVGDVLEVGLHAVSDDETDQMVRGMQVILQWDPAYLGLDETQPLIASGPYPWLLSGFFDDSSRDGLNDTWDDGDAYYQAAGNFQSPAWATTEGLLVTTFRFNALTPTLATDMAILPTLGQYTITQVLGEAVGEDVTGTLGTATTTVEPAVDWGMLTLEIPSGMCGVQPGDTIAVSVQVSDLSQPINGAQMLINFDDSVLSFNSAAAGDGVGSPWDVAAMVFSEVEDAVVTVALVLTGGQSDEDAVVARVEFVYLQDATPMVGTVQLLAQDPPLLTKLTESGTALTVIPELGDVLLIAARGDTDVDGDIDLQDFDALASCLDGPGVTYSDSLECCRVDHEPDDDVDLIDFSEFQVSFTGP